MWNSTELEKYSDLIPSYVRGASIIFIITDIFLCGNKTNLPRKVTIQEGKNLANKEQMIFFEVSAKNGENINKMIYSFIGELPFFEQFQIDNKEQLIKELEGGNNKKEQNFIYDIIKETNNEKQVDLNINGNVPNQNTESKRVIVNKRKKKSGCFKFFNGKI